MERKPERPLLDPNDPANPAVARLAALTRKARGVLGFERAWPRFVAGLVLLSLFITASWLGVWFWAPVWLKIIGVLSFAATLLAVVVFAWRLPRPGLDDALARLDRDSGRMHRPATDLADVNASPGADAVTQALWQAHRARLLAEAEDFKVAPPAPRLFDRDPFAFRYAAIFALLLAAIIAGPEREARILAAFDWSGRSAEAVVARLDGWISPPAYTQAAPILIDMRTPTGSSTRNIRAPVRSEVVIRSTDPNGVEVVGSGGLDIGPQGLVDVTKNASKDAGKEWRFVLTGNATIVVRTHGSVIASIALTAIPDKAPTVTLTEAPTTDKRGALVLGYAFEDDYGVASGEVAVRAPLRNGKPMKLARPSLVPAPTLNLNFGPDPRAGEAKGTLDLRDHAWGGVEVEAQLVVRDDPGQEGRSETFRLTVPQRSFTKPLAKALVEQRRMLVIDPDSRRKVLDALYALMIAPAVFTPETATYLGLRTATTQLSRARTDAKLLEVADYLWAMAVEIEDGGATDAEKALRAAQQALREAMDRNADANELRKLLDDLRRAMDRMVQELAERMMREPNQPQMSEQDMRNMRTITPQDLKSMMDKMEEAMKRGDMAEAQRLLDQLRDIMKNMQAARPRGDNRQAQEMDKALDELDKMTREQQELRDKTFREGQKQREQARRQRQQGQQGQQGQKGQPGQQGDPSDDGESMQSLAERQDALKKRLEQMRKRMGEMGAGEQEGFGEAQDSMGQAEGALGRGSDGEAVDAQGRALENLRKGAQNLAKQMQRQPGEGQGEGDPNGDPGDAPGQSAQGGNSNNEDPLGRKPTRDVSDRAKLMEGGKKSQLETRAREVLEELRRRLGEPERPQGELDYLQRLLGTPQ